MRIRHHLCSAFLAIAFAFASGSACALYTSLVVFGDSLLDGGNARLLNLANPGVGLAIGHVVPIDPFAPPYPPGTTKYTNPGANVAVEVLANRLGVPLAPSVLGGTNFAIGGATTGASNLFDVALVPNPSPIAPVPPGTPIYPGLIGKGIQSEIAAFANRLGGGSADPKALYVLWGGANDLFLSQVLGQAPDPVTSVGNLAVDVTTLYNLGARTVLMPNLPDIGKSPAFVGTPEAPLVTAVSVAFNALLANEIAALENTLPGLDIVPFDTFAAFNNLLAHLGAFGITDSTDPCYLLGAACDPAHFVFWDGDHPTGIVHQILGDLFFIAAVPEPGSVALIAIALLALVWLKRQNGVGVKLSRAA